MTQPIHADVVRYLTEAQVRLGNAILARPEATAAELGKMVGVTENTVKSQLKGIASVLGTTSGRAPIVLSLVAGLRQTWPSVIAEQEVTAVPALPTADQVLIAVEHPGAFVHRRAATIKGNLMQEPLRDWQRRALEAGPLYPEGARPPKRPVRELCNGQHTRTECCGRHGHHVMPHRGCILR